MNDQFNGNEEASIEGFKNLGPTIPPGTILKEIRSWATTLLFLGIISIFASGFLSAPWGVLLIIVGIASFYFRSSAIMVVYSVTLAWAGISNILSGSGLWIGIAIFQWVLVYQVFQKFLSFRNAEVKFDEQEVNSSGLTPHRAAVIFPWAAGVLGVFSLVGLIGVFVWAIVFIIVTNNQSASPLIVFIESLLVNFGVLGFGVGLASILSKHPKRVVSIIGMVAGILSVLIEIILLFI